MHQQRQGSASIWALVLVAFLLGPHLGSALAATQAASVVTRSARPHRADRVAPPPAGLTFTAAHGCDPAADWHSPKLDARVRTLLIRLATHRVRVSCLHTGHSRYVRGTRRVSNHTVWRAVDIDRVAGRRVGPGNPVAKRLAVAIGRGRFGVQPSEVGSPWSFSQRPWFSDAGHQHHLHVGFGP